MQKIYLEMIELSQDPNLNLYIGICAGISFTLFITAFFLNIREQHRARSASLAERKLALEIQYKSSQREVKEVASMS
jgi:hypothetical protein